MNKLLIPVLGLTTWCSGASLSVRLLATAPSPQPVGVAIGLTPHVDNSTKGMHVFRYSVSVEGGPFRVIRDFTQQPDFVWSPALYEHEAKVRVSVRNNDTKDSADAELPFRVVSRVRD